MQRKIRNFLKSKGQNNYIVNGEQALLHFIKNAEDPQNLSSFLYNQSENTCQLVPYRFLACTIHEQIYVINILKNPSRMLFTEFFKTFS